MGCPVKTKEYKDLEELFGEDGALSAWKLNSEKTPATPEDAFKLLHPDGTTIDKDLRAWETPEFGGKSQKEYEPIMDKIILDNPEASLGKGGESYNQAGNRAISVGERILDTAPDKSLVVLNSSILKFIILNEKLGRMPTAKEYLDLHTKPGEQVVLKGKNGSVTFVRHGMTDENKDKLIRSEDAILEDEGKTEADRIGQKLSKDQIPMTYVSPLVRTLQTADRILMKQKPKSDIYYSKDSRFGNGGIPYGNELPEQHQSFSYITDVVDRMNAIRDKKNELKQQGAIITSDNGSQLKWTSPQSNINYQKNIPSTPKQLKYELQSRINQAIQGKGSEGLISDAISVFRRTEGTIREIREGGGEKAWYWRKVQQSGLEYTTSLGTFYKGGVEHDVFVPDDNKNKLNKVRIIPPNQLEYYLKNLIGHNLLFPQTAYKLLGFIERPEGVYPVVEQNKIEGSENEIYNEEEVAKVLAAFGLTKNKYDQYYNEELGIGVEDLNDRNVIFFKGIPYFIDPVVVLDEDVLNPENDPEFSKKQQSLQQKTSSKTPADKQLDNKITKGFLKSVGANVNYVPDTGQDYREVIDAVNGAITIVEGKAEVETLGHAAIHQFIRLLPEGSKLYADILKEGMLSDQYDNVYERYKDDPNYQNVDGTVNENKMAEEAFTHVADDILVEKEQSRRAKRIWERLWQWIKDFAGRVREKLGGKSFTVENLSASEFVSEEILGNHTGRLSKEKLRKMKEANERGEIYYEKDPAKVKRAEELKKTPGITDIQKTIIDNFLLEPTEKSTKQAEELGLKPAPEQVLEPEQHVYTNPATGKVSESVTKRISGEFDETKKVLYKPNANAGDTYDQIFQHVINGQTPDKIMNTEFPLNFASADRMRDFVTDCGNIVRDFQDDGSIAVTQMITSNSESNVTGSKDLSVFHPDGSETIVDLKTSVRRVYDKTGKEDKELSKTYTSKWEQNEGSIFNDLTEKNDNGTITVEPRNSGEKPVKLSKQQQHGIQVGSYAKMDELQGIPIRATKTWHIQVDLQQNDDGTFSIKDYKNEGLRDIPLDSNKQYVDKVIPAKQGELSQLQKDYLDAQDKTIPEGEQPPTPEELKEINESLNTSLEKIKQEFNKREVSALDFTRKSSLEEIKNLVSDIQNLQNDGEVQQAMAKALNYIGTITRENLKFISKDENFKHPKYFQALQEALLVAASDNELLPAKLRKDLTANQKAVFDGIKENMNELEEISGIQAKNYVLRRTASKSVDDDTPIDMAVLEDIYFPKSRKDISQTGSWATDFPGLRNNIIQQAVHTAQVTEKTANVENEAIIKRIADIGNVFMEIPGAKEAVKDDNFWHRIYELKTVTENGKTHQEPYSYINPIGEQYYDLVDKYQSALMNESNEYKKPIIIRNLQDATKEQLEYNIELAIAREANRKFNEPEKLEGSDIADGEYHHLSDEYKKARENIMDGHIITDFDDNPLYIDWRLKKGLDEENADVKRFRNRYQTKIRYEKFVKSHGKYTGMVSEEEGWFPNREYVEINRKSGSGESMENLRYVSLREDQTPIGRGVWNAYNAIMDEYVKGGMEAGGEANRFVRNRGIVGLQAHFFQKAAKTGTLNTLKYNYSEFFTAVHKSNIEKTAPDGITRMQLRIPHIGSLRSREKIAEIEKQITDLAAKKATIGKTAYNSELKELNRQLEMESHKLSPTNIELDPFNQMIMWRTGMHTFAAKQNIEGEMRAYDWALRQQNYEKTTGRGVAKTDIDGNPVFKSLSEVNSFRAMNQLLKNFYGITMEETNLGVLATRFRNLNTLGVMGFNILNGINNTLLYQLNWASHGLSGRYGLTAKNYARANKIMTKEYIPGLAQKRLNKAVKYGGKRVYSKPESLFRALSIAVDQKATEGAPNWATKSFVFEGMAINLAQMGLFIQGMLDYSIPNHETGETVPVWDAFTYDPNTGESNLNTGFIMGDAIESAVKIGDVQTEIQGNFQPINQPAMRSTLLGALMTQFKQFFASSFNNRFRTRFTHPTLGEQEGSWRSVISLVQILKDFDGKWQDAFNPFDGTKRKEFWSEVPDDIKHNLVFDGIDILKLMILFGIGAFIRGLANDVPDSDTTQKRWMNFLAYTASRLRFEQQMWNPVLGVVQMNEFVQNPIAMSNTLRTFAEAMYLSAEFPFQTDDERYYHNGVFKGQSKATHQIMRFLPIAKIHQRWISLTELQDEEGSILGQQK